VAALFELVLIAFGRAVRLEGDQHAVAWPSAAVASESMPIAIAAET